MRVLKFGGTSVANATAIAKVIEIVQSASLNDKNLVVVVSAQSGITDKLLRFEKLVLDDEHATQALLHEIETQHLETVRQLIPIANQAAALAQVMVMCQELQSIVKGATLLQEVTLRTKALMVSFGERLSAFVISQAMHYKIGATDYIDAREIIKTDDAYEQANVNFPLSNQLIQDKLQDKTKMYVVTGFIASTLDGLSTTLGRGGSDYTASIIGAALNVNCIEIWTDVDGVMTADPRFVKEARSVQSMTYNEAMELSHFGAKVIFSATMLPAMNAGIPILVKNTFNASHAGTIISNESSEDQHPVKGISSLRKMALFNVEGSGMAGVAGFSARLFNTLSLHHINVILISQASSEHSICFAIGQQDASVALRVLNEIFERELEKGLINPIQYEQHLAIVAVVGENMRKHAGLASRVFNPLGRNGINLKAIAQGSSELNISIVILEHELEKALRVLHQSLFDHDRQKLHIFIAGYGSIGKRLIEMIKEHHDYLETQKIDLKICGIINRSKMIVQSNEIDKQEIDALLTESCVEANLTLFVEGIINHNLENSLFVDVTASDDPTPHYLTLLDHNVAIVTANKRANTHDYAYYKAMQTAVRKRNVAFHYETNVGAGLPVINVLRDLHAGGDKVIKIEAVLSGTMNYLLSEYNAAVPFSELVGQAKQMGYTEPDPRDDLSGMDVARKCLILAREIGWEMELNEITVEPLMNDAAAKAIDVPAFFDALKSYDLPFEEKYKNAKANHLKIRYVAILENGKASVVAMELNETHPFYTLKGTENCLSLTTKYYQKYPMVIKGPGAGVDVTAAGVLADIVRIAENKNK
jgi:bifunctional aspartokinase / homoserine dehydrogenase 1